jgi:hypothetical protein
VSVRSVGSEMIPSAGDHIGCVGTRVKGGLLSRGCRLDPVFSWDLEAFGAVPFGFGGRFSLSGIFFRGSPAPRHLRFLWSQRSPALRRRFFEK